MSELPSWHEYNDPCQCSDCLKTRIKELEQLLGDAEAFKDKYVLQSYMDEKIQELRYIVAGLQRDLSLVSETAAGWKREYEAAQKRYTDEYEARRSKK